MKPSRKMCAGCRDDFYNGNNPLGVAECWNFKSAEVCKRMLIHVDAPPPYKFKPKRVLSCYHLPRHVTIKPEALTKEGFWK